MRVIAIVMGVLLVARNGVAIDELPPAVRCDERTCCTCPDDYCPKPLPCVTCAPRGICDCYCPKPLPYPPNPLRWCAPDDYCPKPCCLRLPPCSPAWYSCGASRCLPTTQCPPGGHD